MPVIRDPAPVDETAWRRLWAGYTAFYQTDVPEAVTAGTWTRALAPDAPLLLRLAEHDGVVAGFSLCVVHAATWSLKPYGYLEDLFVDPAARGMGLGAALVEDVVARGRTLGWGRVYWHTREDNPARRLYDRFSPADGFVRYRLSLS